MYNVSEAAKCRMEAFNEFITHMSSQLPEHFFNHSTELQPGDYEALKAAYLWSLLEMIHDDLNALCRRNPNGLLGLMSIETVNRAFAQVRELLGDNPGAGELTELQPLASTTHSDALVSLSMYKSALRQFRVDHLKQNPYSF